MDTEEKTSLLNQDFVLDPKKHKILLKMAHEIFEDPSKIAEADILSVSPENPALASKLFLSAYTRALKEKASKINIANKETVLDEINAKYSAFITEYLKKNKSLFDSLANSKSNSNGGKSL